MNIRVLTIEIYALPLLREKWRQERKGWIKKGAKFEINNSDFSTNVIYREKAFVSFNKPSSTSVLYPRHRQNAGEAEQLGSF